MTKTAKETECSYWPDPRPDLAEDTEMWSKLLRRAFAQDSDDPTGLYGILRGIRCCGAKLVRGTKALRIEPRYGVDDGWEDEAAWKVVRERWLVPHTVELRDLLQKAR